MTDAEHKAAAHMKNVSDKYVDLWIEQAACQKKRNPGDHASVDLDSWLSLLRELRARRAAARRAKPWEL